MAKTSIYDFILGSKTSKDASVIHKHVTAYLSKLVGPVGVPLNLSDDARNWAIHTVKKLLSTILTRLQQTPEIDIYQTHIHCQKYLKSLCPPEDPSSNDYLLSRCDLMYVYVYLEKFEEAQREGLEVLNEIHILFAGSNSRIPKGQVLPTYHYEMNLHTAKIVIDVSKVLLYARSCYIKEDDMLDDLDEFENRDIYKYILSLAREMDSYIELFSSDPSHRELTNWLAKFFMVRTLPLIEKRIESTILLIPQFCTMTLSNFAKASMNDAMCNFGRYVCHSLFSNWNGNLYGASDIVISVLKRIAERCREHHVDVDEFLELAVFCTVNHRMATAEECDDLASFFHTTSNMFLDMASPPKVDSIHVHLLLKHLAIALVISDLDSYKRFANPGSSPHTILEDSNALEAHLREWTQLIFNKYPELDIFFYDRLSTLVFSNEIFDAHEVSIDHIELPTLVPAVLDCFIDTYCGSERNELTDNKHIEVAAKVGVAYFTLILTTKEDMKRSNDALMKLKKESRIKPKLLEYLTQILEKVSRDFEDSGRINEAIESSKLCCMMGWERVSDFCEMLGSTEYGVSSGFSEYAIVDLVQKASEDSGSLLNLLSKHRRAELDIMLIELVKTWLDANNIFDIPIPVALFHRWVDIQYGQTQDNSRNVLTIYSLVQSLKTLNQSGGIILEQLFLQELHEYQKNKDRYPDLCKEMEMLIEDSISKTSSSLSRSDSLIKCGARIASCGPVPCQMDSIIYLDQAISILVDLNTNKGVTGEHVLPLLMKAYCSKALFKRILHPSVKEFTEDIGNALKAWDHHSAFHDEIKLCDNDDINLFFSVADLLALEGNRELNSKLYKMMIKRVKLAVNCDMSDFLELAWKSGSLNHALCPSPVDALIIKEIEDTNVQFWINCGKTQEQKAGIKQCLSVLPTLSSVNLHDDAHAKEAQETVNEAKEAVSTLHNEGSDTFGAARLHYNLAEMFIAKGLFLEALSHATKSYLLRDKHLSECFDINSHEGQEMIFGQEDTEITKYDCTKFTMNPSSVSPFAHSSSQTYPTPWSTLRCYLESSLQIGTVKEMNGNGDEAEIYFLRGQKIASLHHLPMFVACFSRALGKIYQKKGLWALAFQNLKYAREHNCSSTSCLECTLISKVTVNLQLGDFYLSRSQNEVKEKDDLKNAKDLYVEARRALENNVWDTIECLPKPVMDTNDMKKAPNFPSPEISKTPKFCYAFGIPSARGSEEECWHCRPSMSEKSLFLTIHMKWECLRRCHMVRLLTRLGKCCKLQGEIKEEYNYLLESVCIVVCRSTFWKQSVSTTFVEELLSKGVTGDAHAVEHASVLYKMCCFSILHKDTSKDVDKLSIDGVKLGLKLAFVLSQESRKLNEKVSRLLAVMYACSEDNSTPECVSVSRLASYFHQSSVGSDFNSCFLSQDQNLNVVEDLNEVLAPRSLPMLETSVSKFFDILPEVSVLCISMLDGDSEKFLKLLLPSSQTSAWIMISKMRLNREPILVILPISKVFGDILNADTSLVGNWSCPWAHSVFDKVAPLLRRIVEEDNKIFLSEMESQKKKEQRRDLDRHLQALLRGMEREWFGRWKHLLLGEWLTVEEIKNHLSKNEFVNDNEKSCTNPLVLVLGNEIQMAPIGSMPLLRKQEIYRMPSVGGIIWSISRHTRSTEDKLVVDTRDQTVIDPTNCYYFIYTDIEEMKSCFDKWSKAYHQFKGRCIDYSKSRDEPETLGVDTLNELREELKKCDLFVYLGHGDGRKLIKGQEIRKLDRCGAAFLIGCSSGYINYSKSHVPDGAPLDYLLGGSPAIVSTIWPVGARCMSHFTKELLETMIDTMLADVVDCDQAAHIKANNNKNPNKRKAEDEDNGSRGLCIHKRNLGSLFIKAREKVGCSRLYIDLAATIIYGVPVHITGNNQIT